jgi:hypothetical protein
MKFQTDNILLEQEDNHVALHDSTDKFQSMSESDLWDLFKNGDTEVFNFIYVKYFPILINYGHQFTKDRELVKDVIQDSRHAMSSRGCDRVGTTCRRGTPGCSAASCESRLRTR